MTKNVHNFYFPFEMVVLVRYFYLFYTFKLLLVPITVLFSKKTLILCILILCILFVYYNSRKPIDDLPQVQLKYILQWTSPHRVPFVDMGKGQETFIQRKCQYTNCFVTSDRSYLEEYTKFDVIAFALPEISYITDLPINRSPHQKFVFASIESSHNYPICSNRFDGYFNWTWTYRLESEVKWGYILIRDRNNSIIGPKKVMHWLNLEEMDPVKEEFKKQLSKKTRAATWFVSNCYSRSNRENFVESLAKELKKYDLEIDIYGKCYNRECPQNKDSKCDRLIREQYYFYLSFENAFSEDYVTEKLLRGLQNNAIPIVYGGANYTRFMPDGIYLNARELGIEKLASKMDELIRDSEQYAQYFKWKNHYSYHGLHESAATDPYCLFCASLNNESMVNTKTVYHNFREWWDPPDWC